MRVSAGPVRAIFFFGLTFDYEAPRSKVGIFTKRLGQRSVYTRSASTIVWKALMLHTDSGSLSSNGPALISFQLMNICAKYEKFVHFASITQ